MSRFETVLSPPVPGAGRTHDWMWPVPAVSYFAGASAGVYSRTQYRASSNYVQYNTNLTGVGGAIAPALYQGTPVYSLTSGVATVPGTGPSTHFAFNAGLPSPSVPLGIAGIINGGSADPRHVVRTWAILAFVGTPAADQDFGFELLCPANANTTSIIHDNAQGFGWIKRASGAISFIVNGPGGLAFHDVVPAAGFNASLLNAYEMRLTAATVTAPASLVGLVNGQTLFTANWAAGTALPVYNAALGQLQMELINYGGNNLAMHCQSFKFVTAPTLQNTF